MSMRDLYWYVYIREIYVDMYMWICSTQKWGIFIEERSTWICLWKIYIDMSMEERCILICMFEYVLLKIDVYWYNRDLYGYVYERSILICLCKRDPYWYVYISKEIWIDMSMLIYTINIVSNPSDFSHIHTYVHTYIHTYIYTYIYTHIHTYIFTHTYIHIHVHIYLSTVMFVRTYVHL